MTIPLAVPDVNVLLALISPDHVRYHAPHAWFSDTERHEALLNLAVVKGHRSAPVAAGV